MYAYARNDCCNGDFCGFRPHKRSVVRKNRDLEVTQYLAPKYISLMMYVFLCVCVEEITCWASCLHQRDIK